MKRFTLLKTLLVAVGLCGSSSVWAVDSYTWDFTNTITWTTSKVTTGSAVTLSPSANAPSTGEYGVTFNFATDAGLVKKNSASGSVSATGLWYATAGSATTNNVSIALPVGFKVTFNLVYGSSTRPFVVTKDGGTTTSSLSSGNYEYKNETESEVTVTMWASNPNRNGTPQNCITSIVLEDYSAVASHDWSVKAVIKNTSTEIASWAGGTVQEGETYTVIGKKVIVNDGKYYELDDDKFAGDNLYYNNTMTTSDMVNELSYTLNENIVAFVEGEAIQQSSASDKCSAGAYCGYLGSPKFASTFTIANSGVYEMESNVVGREDKYSLDIFPESTTTLIASLPTGSKGVRTSNAFCIAEDNTTIRVGGYYDGSKYQNSLAFDYILIRKIDYSVPTTIGATGYTTFSSAYPLDLSSLPDGLTAYYVSAVSPTEATLTATTGTVAAGEGLILAGTANVSYDIPVVASGTAISGNKLVGCATATEASANDYVLANNNGKAEFQYLTAAMTVPAGKAYLPNSVFGAKSRLTIVFEGDVTGIEAIEATSSVNDGVIYNLAGQRVANPTKGIFIKNGKKFIIK